MMNDSRRTLLRGLAMGAAATAGCVGPATLTGGVSRYRLTSATASVVNPTDPALTVAATIVDSTATRKTPGKIVFSIRNTGDEPIRYAVGPPSPFGILDDAAGEEGLPLWSPAYERSEFLFTEGYRIRGQNDAALDVRLGPEESVSTQYILPPTLANRGSTNLQNSYGRSRGLIALEVLEGRGADEVTIKATLKIRRED